VLALLHQTLGEIFKKDSPFQYRCFTTLNDLHILQTNIVPFLGLVVIKLFLEMSIFEEFICIKC
jgi:hypothetical protein